MIRSTFARTAAALAVLAALGLLQAEPAGAFWRRKAREPESTPARAVNRHRFAPMEFRRGVLHDDGGGRWRLDDLPLADSPEARIDGPEGGLVSGREAVVAGWRRGAVLVVHYVTVIASDRSVARGLTAGRTVSGGPRPAPANVPR